MSAHEKGIEAGAFSIMSELDKSFGCEIGTMWKVPSADGGFGHQRLAMSEFQRALIAYLEASDQVLVPRQPSIEMSLAGGAVTVTHWENDRDYQDPIEAYAAEIVWEKMLGAYPQPFSEADKT